MNKQFSNQIRIIQSMCAILVVMIHCYNIDIYDVQHSNPVYWIEQFISEGVARIAVPTFFCISAFFTFYKSYQTTEFWKKKIRTLFIPYIIWNSLYMIMFSILSKLNLVRVNVDFSIESIIKGVFFYNNNYAFWFMYQLILFSLLYPIFKQIIRNKTLSIFILISATVLYLLKGDCLPSESWHVIRLSAFIFYWFGAILGKYYFDETKSAPGDASIVFPILAFAVFGIFILLINFNNMEFWGNFDIIRNAALMIGLYLVIGKLKISFTWNIPLFMIYAIHPILLEIIEKIVYLIFPHSPTFALIDYIFAPVITIAIIISICFLLKKYVNGLYRVVSGSR